MDGQTASRTPRERRSLSPLLVLLLVPVAIATAGALLLLRLHFQPPTVPRYALANAAPDGQEAVLLHGARFELVLKPVEPIVGAVGARAFLLRGSEVRPWDAPFDVGRDGSVRVAGPVDTLFANVPTGPWEVAIAVGRPETLPTAPRDILRAREASSDAGPAPWQLVRERIRLGD